MNAHTRQYFFGIIFLAVGIYQLVKKNSLEASLYIVAGAAFIFNTLATEPKFTSHKKILVIITWGLIITAGVLFLYLLQFRFL
ncbi:MAG: hypothetical protein OEV74_05320 [Cyclobacteriaceae bacterium]|nr:hypothetical protein [Cyclobacteriaceae bacterium]MDH4295680.1 hypothetical protein [Cyclobacteriaceae bacterium]MDH5247489.1 hypothetical protein [Cyclobacteriaceae bacterium]